MAWKVRFVREFDREFAALDEAVQIALVSHANVLERLGPGLGRPVADTLRGSAFSNMKELRFNAGGGVWRVAFAFDTDSRGILLVAGDKADLWDKSESAFYERLIGVADERFAKYLKRIETAKKIAAAARTRRAEAAGGNRKRDGG